MDRTEAELLTALQGGDDAALGELLRLNAPAIHRFGVQMCGDTEDAKDVVQETLLAAARGLRDFRSASSLSTWLFTIARSFCIKHRRTSKFAPKRTVSLDDQVNAPEVVSPAARPDDEAASHELGALLDEAILSLDPANREVLVLRDVEGLTAPEVAEIVGISIDAVKSRLHRARSEVRARLEPELMGRAPKIAKRPEPCPDVIALFSRYVEGDIGAAECAAMEQHVAGCAQCEAACGSLKTLLAMCRDRPAPAITREVQERIRGAVRIGRLSSS